MSLWEPDILNGYGKSRPADGPERRLARAILEDALRCALDGHTADRAHRPWKRGLATSASGSGLHWKQDAIVERRRRERQLAWEWLMSEDEGYVLSFLNICRLLDLDARTIRRKVRENKEVAKAKHRSP